MGELRGGVLDRVRAVGSGRGGANLGLVAERLVEGAHGHTGGRAAVGLEDVACDDEALVAGACHAAVVVVGMGVDADRALVADEPADVVAGVGDELVVEKDAEVDAAAPRAAVRAQAVLGHEEREAAVGPDEGLGDGRRRLRAEGVGLDAEPRFGRRACDLSTDAMLP